MKNDRFYRQIGYVVSGLIGAMLAGMIWFAIQAAVWIKSVLFYTCC
jgi:hypothetical protein